jgi:hypothetical protein
MSATKTVTTNRVLSSIQRIQARIVELGLDEATLVEKGKGLDMGLEEYVTFQVAKSLAFATGVLTFEEAQTIYGFLGESVETFNRQSYVVKVALTKLFAELMGVR